jgi:cation transport regulator ChaC
LLQTSQAVNKVLYFAYGSCMGDDFARTVPMFIRIGSAVVNGYRLAFTRYTWMRGGGVADIVPMKGKRVEGVLYEFDAEFLPDVDGREGVPVGAYQRIRVIVETQSGKVTAWTYEVVDKARIEYPPSNEYAKLLLDAAKAYLSPEYTKELRRHIETLQSYERIAGAEYQMLRVSQQEAGGFEEELVAYANRVVSVDKSIYDAIPFDSEVEAQFARDLDSRSDIKLFVKLPPWFQVDTPLGKYNPDWAIVKQPDGEDCKLYLIRETKGGTRLSDLRESEQAKIACGQAHFAALGVDYRHVSSAREV